MTTPTNPPPPPLPKEPLPAYTSENTTAPDWDIPAQSKGRKRGILGGGGIGGRSSATRTRWALSNRFDRVLPPHKRYLGRSRRTLLICIAVLFLLLLGLVIGLAVGLAGGKSKPQNLPLPSSAQTHSGDLTYYGVGLGACGVTATDADAIVSISHYTFDAAQRGHGSNPNNNPLCGRKIRARRGERSVDVTVIDRCTGCQPTDLDVSPAVFKELADPGLGRVGVEWAWL
ncbi:hypothetical protein CC80DRAFT_527443 [Byssothecium circinans]|uniref:RlpA-like protein double-psi beta-barrel domain-containing protein n=1 Tax=Byssothecium circinans TaxID=147558 RepID=A0A6A5TMI9_9PLEO|nr:hypothetical protein CC80DRAFT_527443 [Byssothecium circinans]